MVAKNKDVVITGMGIITPTAIGVDQFSTSLQEGKTNFSTIAFERGNQLFEFPVAKIEHFEFKEYVAGIQLDKKIIDKVKRVRNISWSSAYGIATALQAWSDAQLNYANIDLEKVAIISAGTNTQLATLQRVRDEYNEKLQYLNPNYGFNFFDTDLVGILSELLEIKGEGHSIGAASASGNMAIIQGSRLIKSGLYDLVLIVAPLMDISIYEYQAFSTLGAMARLSGNAAPSEICRPFDKGHSGFVYGQSAGCLVIESACHAAKRGKQVYASVAGCGVYMDANRNPNPSIEGEKNAMLKALKYGEINVHQIDYINTHGTGSVIGDDTEAGAIISAGLKECKANSTKSLIGHSLSAAGVVEAIACLVQMNEGFIHKNHNLLHPVTDEIHWIKDKAHWGNINYAMSNSFGFGGINTSIILKNSKQSKL